MESSLYPEMEHFTAPGFDNPGEWDRASYEHHPCEDIDGPIPDLSKRVS
jgi:hypothetical protein